MKVEDTLQIALLHFNVSKSHSQPLQSETLCPIPPRLLQNKLREVHGPVGLDSTPLSTLTGRFIGRKKKKQESTAVPMVAWTQPRLYPLGTKQAACCLRRGGLLHRCYLCFLQVTEENRNLSLQEHSKKHCNTIRFIRIIIIAFRQMASITLSKH